MMMVVMMMVVMKVTLLLSGTSASSLTSGAPPAAPCPPRCLLVGQRRFAFYPVWSSWSAAESLCRHTGGHLASLHTAEERRFVRQLADSSAHVWLGGYRQNGSWFWSDESPLRIGGWTNQSLGRTTEGRACMQMEPKSEELHVAPCGELRFYICSTTASSEVSHVNRKPDKPDVVPGVSLFDVVWGYSDSLAEEILRSSSFLEELWSGHMTQRCYTSFLQQEALYLHRVSSTLEALLSSLQEADDVRSLLVDTLKHYSNINQSLLTSSSPQWLHFSLQSFHSVVQEEPVYWLVALSARACLRSFLSEHRTGTLLVRDGGLYQEWSEESLQEVAWTQRYRKVMEEHQHQMEAFKAINIFREHMMNQKSFYKALACDEED